MKTVSEIRRANLERLIEELGSLESVAFAGGSSAIYLSQVRHQAIDQKTGKMRQMGNAIARRLDKGSGKPEGWMDRDHSSEASPTKSSTVPPDLKQNHALASVSPAHSAINNIASIEQIMAALADYLVQMDDYARDNAADVLRRLTAHPEEHARAAALFTTAFQSGKQRAA